jgi:asparagine synthase (glutamine-hydrolysing)
MDSICGQLAFDGRPLSEDRLLAMMAAIPNRGGGSPRIWSSAVLQMAHRVGPPAATTGAAAQPLVAHGDDLVLVADARIDDRERLLGALAGAGQSPGTDASDAELILASYRAWGLDCPSRLVGDFAFALWDAPARRLLLARDPMGVRQLYFARLEGGLVFGSTIGAVREGLPSSPSLNRPLALDLVATVFDRWIDQTIWSEIERLPASYALCVGPEGLRRWQHYVFGSTAIEGLVSEADWIEAFRDRLARSIADRSRDPHPIAILTGGGLDSSALAAMAHDMAGRGHSLPPIHLISGRFDRTPRADEIAHFRTLGRHCVGFEAHEVPADDLWAFREMGRDRGFPLDEPEVILIRAFNHAMLRAARDHGAGAVMLGQGANELFAEPVYASRSVLRSLGWRERWAEARYFRRESGWSWPQLVFEATLRPSLARLPESWRASGRRALGLPPVDNAPWRRLPDFILHPPQDPDRRAARIFATAAGLSPAAELAHALLRGPHGQALLSHHDLLARVAGMEMRFPYLDRRLLDLMAWVPRRQWFSGGENRRILRQGMQGLLPDSIRVRRGDRDLVGLVQRGFAREAERLTRLVDASIAADLGIIDLDCYTKFLMRILNRERSDWRYAGMPACLELWLRFTDEPHPSEATSV